MDNQKSLKRWAAYNAAAVLIMVPLILISFQNCAPKSFSVASDGSTDITGGVSTPTPTATPDPTGDLVLLDQLVTTTQNTPVSFNAQTTGDRTGYSYSFSPTAVQTSITIPNEGTVTVTDPTNFGLQFVPATNYHGEIVMTVYAINGSKLKSATLTIDVGSTVNLLAPALAIRGSGCISCHAEVQANIITDFGYGDTYFFGQNPPANRAWDNGLIFGDHQSGATANDGSEGTSWSTVRLIMDSLGSGAGKKVYVPAGVSIPSGPATVSGSTTLSGYLAQRAKTSVYDDSRTATVYEKNSLYIGAPTVSRLQTVFGWSSSDEAIKYKYLADSSGRGLSGLNTSNSAPSGNVFRNTGTVVCEGDLMLEGTVYLDHLNLDTKTGCRIYATGSVFIYGPITYTGIAADSTITDATYANSNLQITSATSVMMGLGNLFNNNVHCEANSEDSGYWGMWQTRVSSAANLTPAQQALYYDAITSSAKYRLTYFWGIAGMYRRNDSRTPVQINAAIYNELINANANPMDAACGTEGRDVAYQRILLNAPLIESRYAGGFKGSIIAEAALMSLGLEANQSRFRFEFDSVFQQVSILPKLSEQDYLSVQ